MRIINFLRRFTLGFIIILSSTSYATDDIISLFPIENYNQTVSHWINPAQPKFDTPLMNINMQKQHMRAFLEHYVGNFSPWSSNYVNKLLHSTGSPGTPDSIKSVQENFLTNFDNEGKSDDQIGYGENFRPYTKEWITDIAANINISQFDNLVYQKNNRAIAVENLNARALPTDEVFFYNRKIAGEGYPFDNLQVSVLWAGTPVYIVGVSRDSAWKLIITPEYIAWVKSRGLARAENDFIATWTAASKNKLAAITKTKTSLIDKEGHFQLTAYVGSVFPATLVNNKLRLMIPVRKSNHKVQIKYALISHQEGKIMPLQATPHNFSEIIQTMIGRPYGWGGMYFYNDCSAELKSLLTPFGIWLPRNSGEQAHAGKTVDLAQEPEKNRLAYLTQNGHPFLTMVYIGHHIILYVGNYTDPNNPSTTIPLTYQNIWGLKPATADRRAVIGQSVLFPMLSQYPEDPSLKSLANSNFFQLTYLDQLADQDLFLQQLDIKSLMHPMYL